MQGQVATLPLTPAVVDAVDPVPVLAAGGIADGRGLAAVLALGAVAGWIGTRFLLAAEAHVHPEYRTLLGVATETDTAYGDIFDGGWPDAPHRTLRNSTVAAWETAGLIARSLPTSRVRRSIASAPKTHRADHTAAEGAGVARTLTRDRSCSPTHRR